MVERQVFRSTIETVRQLMTTEDGAETIECGLLVTLIAAVATVGVQMFGTTLGTWYVGTASQVNAYLTLP